MILKGTSPYTLVRGTYDPENDSDFKILTPGFTL